KGAGGEIQLTDAMQTLMKSQSFTGVKYRGQSFDCGSKIGFLTANVVYALDRDDIRDGFLQELRKLDLDGALEVPGK
ncbi:MAG: UTP--glucose-1-phosphate uridylyltransferase, partial [Devosia sp.]